jgi:hypothetical protein
MNKKISKMERYNCVPSLGSMPELLLRRPDLIGMRGNTFHQ